MHSVEHHDFTSITTSENNHKTNKQEEERQRENVKQR